MISIHAPRGGSDGHSLFGGVCATYFNPRSPWGERPSPFAPWAVMPLFQSTLPVGGATAVDIITRGVPDISIHAPRGGSDNTVRDGKGRTTDFNPRSPWGERPGEEPIEPAKGLFQSTLPVGGATHQRHQENLRRSISIHAPRGGSDGSWLKAYSACKNFNPRSPWGERPFTTGHCSIPLYFNPRSPWGERQCW